MRRLIAQFVSRLPLEFRVLYRQFLLRVIDLEALSIHADVTRFLGQFAGLLILYSCIQAVGAFFSALGPPPPPEAMVVLAHHTEQSAIEVMMLVVGLIAVVSWDATFPDRRDVMVLSPLPIAPRTILFAKVAASSAIIGIAILALNCASSFAWSLILEGFPGALRFLPAWWFTMLAASAFLYGSVLTVQGLSALLLSRRVFLRVSAILQLLAFGLFLGVYFLEPSVLTPGLFTSPENRWILASSPTYWFYALFNQLNGTLPAGLNWLAARAWIGLGIVVAGAAASLLLCYMRTMKKTVEDPDLVPGVSGSHRSMPIGGTLQTAIMHFSLRSLVRSRQHRVIYAFYLSIVFAIALSLLKDILSTAAPIPISPALLIPTILMMCFSVIGLRNVFPLPISLTANWILRITQLRPTQKYIDATQGSMLLFAVAPAWILSALLSLFYRPWQQVAEHLLVLALLGVIFAELSLIGFYKVPFTCSYLPGKSNIQFAFWGFVVVLLVLAVSFAPFEYAALSNASTYSFLIVGLAVSECGLIAFNRHRSKSAELYFEEPPEEPITTLRLISAPSSRNE
jgi:hypothetical protein